MQNKPFHRLCYCNGRKDILKNLELIVTLIEAAFLIILIFCSFTTDHNLLQSLIQINATISEATCENTNSYKNSYESCVNIARHLNNTEEMAFESYNSSAHVTRHAKKLMNNLKVIQAQYKKNFESQKALQRLCITEYVKNKILPDLRTNKITFFFSSIFYFIFSLLFAKILLKRDPNIQIIQNNNMTSTWKEFFLVWIIGGCAVIAPKLRLLNHILEVENYLSNFDVEEFLLYC